MTQNKVKRFKFTKIVSKLGLTSYGSQKKSRVLRNVGISGITAALFYDPLILRGEVRRQLPKKSIKLQSGDSGQL